MPNYILLVGIIFLLILPCLQRTFEKGSWSLFYVFNHFFPHLNWRITGWLRSKGISGGQTRDQPCCSGTSGASCPGSSPDGFWGSPKMEIAPCLWASCARAQSLPQYKSVSRCSSLCPLPLLLTLGASGRAWLHPLCPLSLHIYRCWWDLVLFFRMNIPALSDFSHRSGAPVPSSS